MPITSSDLLLALGVTSLSFPRVTALPSSPDIGEVCFLQSANKAYIYTGVDWEILGNPPNSGSGSGGSTTVINNTIDLPSQTSKAGKYLTTNGTAASWADIPEELPTQTGNSGKMLITDGTVPSWAVVPSGGSDTPELPPQAGNSGKVLSTDGTSPSWVEPEIELPPQAGNANKMLVTNGTSPAWINIPTEIPAQVNNSGKVLSTNGTAASWISLPTPPSIYDIAYSNPEQVPSASTLLYFAFPRQVTVPNTFAGSYASAMGVFTDADISIRRNGVEIGIVSFSSDTGNATFSGAAPSDIVFGVGDIISIESPADTNLLGVSIAVSGITT